MKSYRQSGDILTRTVPSGETYTVDVPVVIGNLVAIPQITSAEGELCSLYTKGTFELAKSTDTEHGDISFGDTLYWDAANANLTKNPEGNTRFGTAIQDAAAAATVVEALLDPVSYAEGVVELTAPTGGVTAGDFVKVGGIHGKVLNTAAQTEAMYVQARGVVSITKTTADANGVLAEGDTIYWDDGNSRITKDGTGNTKIGYAVKAQIQADTTGLVMLTPA